MVRAAGRQRIADDTGFSLAGTRPVPPAPQEPGDSQSTIQFCRERERGLHHGAYFQHQHRRYLPGGNAADAAELSAA